MQNFLKYTLVAAAGFLFASGVAYSASNVDRIRRNFINGMSVGNGGSVMSKHLSTVTSAINLAAGAANVAVTGTATITGAALGDDCQVVPLLDDAAWDEGSLSCFVESADTVKIVYHPDATGGDPASMTYRVTITKY